MVAKNVFSASLRTLWIFGEEPHLKNPNLIIPTQLYGALRSFCLNYFAMVVILPNTNRGYLTRLVGRSGGPARSISTTDGLFPLTYIQQGEKSEYIQHGGKVLAFVTS